MVASKQLVNVTCQVKKDCFPKNRAFGGDEGREMGFYIRLRTFAKPGETDAEFARRMGVDKGVLSRWKSGLAKPDFTSLRRIGNKLKLDQKQGYWLVFGGEDG